MKILFKILFFIAISNSALAQALNKQSTYLDAIELKRIYTDNDRNDYTNNTALRNAFFTIVNKYGLDESNLQNNPFFTKIDIQVTRGVREKIAPYSDETADEGLASGSNWQSLLINSLATFMAKQAKTEAIRMALDQLFRKINTTDQATIEVLFPSAFTEIKKIYNEGTETYYAADISYIQKLIRNDLDELPNRIGENPKVIFPKLSKQLASTLSLSYHVFSFSREGRDLPSLITLVSEQNYDSEEIKASLQLADLLAQATRNPKDAKGLWVQLSKLEPVSIKDMPLETRFFYGLLYQQLTQITHPTLKQFATALSNTADNEKAEKMRRLLSFTKNCNEAYGYLKLKQFDLRTADEIFLQIKNTVDIFSTLLQNPELKTTVRLDPKLGSTINDFLEITNLFIKKNYGTAIPVMVSKWGQYFSTNENFNRSLSFMSQLGTLETDEQMDNLLNAYALPIGSSSIKRFSKFNISLNGYVGFNGGSETAFGEQKNQTKTNFGLTAPIGVSLTFGGEFTTFFSFIDLASIVNVRLNNDTSYYAGLKLEQFFSPGVGLYYNFKRFPLSIGAHYSYIPNLRNIKYEVNNASVTETARSVSRINVSILFDIPLLTLFNNTK